MEPYIQHAEAGSMAQGSMAQDTKWGEVGDETLQPPSLNSFQKTSE